MSPGQAAFWVQPSSGGLLGRSVGICRRLPGCSVQRLLVGTNFFLGEGSPVTWPGFFVLVVFVLREFVL